MRHQPRLAPQHPRQLSALGMGIARKGGLTKADVINTLPLEKLRKELAASAGSEPGVASGFLAC